MVNELENNVYLVNAPAGSGKTTWIRKEVENHLIRYPDDNILCITYTNRAAEELGRDLDTSRVYFGTIHKFISDFIGSFFSHRVIIDLYWEIYKEQIIERIENKEQKESITEGNQRYIEKYGDLYLETIYKNINEISYNEASFNSLYRGALSHDDLISFTRIAVDKFPVIKKKIAEKYQLVFIDEYQDTAADVLHIFYTAMHGKNGKMYLLGDKMQQIYKNYDGSFEETFRQLNKTVALDINYRTTPKIVEILNAIYNDNSFKQKPYENNSNDSMDFKPRVVFTNDMNKTLSDFISEYKDALVLYLSNKERFYGIGAGNLYDAFNKMEQYKYGRKYTAVDILTKEELREQDILLKLLFLLVEICKSYDEKRYGDTFRFIRKNPKIFNVKDYLVKKHSDKTEIKEYLDQIICKYNKENTKIGELVEECRRISFITEEYYGAIKEEKDYELVLEVGVEEVRHLSSYLLNPKISTQHGVKGESHDTVVFIAENSSSPPVVHMSNFFELWSKTNVSLFDFDSFYYRYLNLLKNIEVNCGLKPTQLNKESYEKHKSKISELIEQFVESNKNNQYYVQLLQDLVNKYLLKPNCTNAKACLKENLVYGSLSAYRLFYVGCSRARKNLEIIIRNEDVASFKSELSNKLKVCGFDVVEE